MKTKTLLSILFLGAATVTGFVVSRPVDAATCANGLSKKVKKIGGTTSGYPSTCRINKCRVEGKTGIISHLEPFPQLALITDAVYRVEDGYVSNNCPASVSNAAWQQ